MKRYAARRLPAVMLSISILFQIVGGPVFDVDSGCFLLPGMVSAAQER